MTDILDDLTFEKFRKLIYDSSGITFSDTNRAILDSRVKERLRSNHLTPESYYETLKKDPDELKQFLDSVTTNLTRFFRNMPHFEAFENYVLPEVIKFKKKRNPSDTKIRVWSAGCSTGEEPYTIAMIMREKLPAPYVPEIIASDLSLKSLMVGKQGFYPKSRITGIPDDYLSKYFTPKGDGYQAKDSIMDIIKFDYHNLKNDSGLKNVDVVFCRNVLIYFDEQAQEATVNRFWDAMAPQSFLFIGHAESLFGMKTKFEFLKTEWACLYTKNT